MIAAKWVAYVAALVMAGLILSSAAAYLLVDDETLVAWFAKGAELATGVDISYRKPVKLTRTLSPTLLISDLSVTDPETGYGLHTSSLEVQISLPRLVQGQLDVSRLWLGDTRVELSDAATADEQHGLPSIPALHDVRIAQLQFVSEQRQKLLPTLNVNELTLAVEPDTDTLQLKAQIDMADQSVVIEARVPKFHDGFNARTIHFSASARSSVASLLINGQLDFAKPEFIIDGNLLAQASDLKWIPTGIQGLEAPGKLVAQAQLSGTVDRLAVSDIRLQWQGPIHSSLEIRGRIDDLDDFTGVALNVFGRLGESPWLAAIQPDNVGALKHAEFSAKIFGASQRLQIREFSLAARDSNELDVSLSGRLDLAEAKGHAEAENIDLELVFSAPKTRAARVLFFDEVPEFGAIKGRVDVRSKTGHPSFENIVVSARGSGGVAVDMSGRIAKFPLSPTEPNLGYDLDITMKTPQVSLMTERLGLDLSMPGPATATFRVEGDTEALRLERIKLTAGTKQALRLGAEGQIHFRHWKLQDPLQMLNLDLHLHSRDTRAFARLLDIELPELGALSAEARLKTVSNRHRITDFQVQTGKRAPISVSLSGAVGRLVLLPELAVEDIALSASASTVDVTRLNALFGWKMAIPAIGAAEASAKLSGNDREFSVSNVSISAGKPNILLIEARGQLGTMAANNDWQPQNSNLSLRASASGSKALAKLLGYRLPELGSLEALAKIRDKDGKLEFESERLMIGDSRAPVIEAEGFVDDLFGAGKTRWDVEFDLAGHHIAAFADLPKLSDLGALRGALHISNSDGSLGIDMLRVRSTGSEQITLDVFGQYGDFSKPGSLSFIAQLKARDMQTVGVLFDQNWPAVGSVSIFTHVSKSDEHTAFDTRLVVDEFELDADLVAVLDAEPPRLSGELRARNAFIPQMAEQLAEDVKQIRQSKGPFFSQEPLSLDWLNEVDLDLSLEVESFDPELSRGKSARASFTLKSGRLVISPVTIDYPKGQLELDLQIELRDRPRIRVQVFGESLDPWRSLYVEEFKKQIDADLNIDIDLELFGASPRELAASAKGDIYMELENGLLRRDLVDLVFADIIGWVWGKTWRDKYYEFSCGVADYRIDQGVVTTKAFLLDSENIAISGDGTIDLGKEQVDYVLLPKKKSKIISRADPVQVTGDLSDPSVKVIPWKSATRTYGTYSTLLFAPYIFAGVTAADFLWGVVKKAIQESPCLEYEKHRAAAKGVLP